MDSGEASTSTSYGSGNQLSNENSTWISSSLCQLYTPDPVDSAEIDIFFLHGFQIEGASDDSIHISTWKSASSPEEIWPKCWLSADYPRARIITVSYDACIETTGTEGRMDLFLLGENLIQEIIYVRPDDDESSGRPTILVGHGVGGLVIKQLCVHASEKRDTYTSEDQRKISKFLKSIRGIFFYSTPHWGAQLQEMPSLPPEKEGPMRRLMHVLNPDVARLENSFRPLQQQWIIYALGETQPIAGQSKPLVSEASSRYGGNYITVASDHFSACRPVDKKCNKYQHLIKLIEATNAVKSEDLPEMVFQTVSPITVVGGNGGCSFSCYGGSRNKTLKTIGMWACSYCIKAIRVCLTDDDPKIFGDETSGGLQYEEFTFHSDERIIRLDLWDNGRDLQESRAVWIAFETNEGRNFSFGMSGAAKARKHSADVGSGICIGVLGQSGLDIDRLGFVFIKQITNSKLLTKILFHTPVVITGGNGGAEYSYYGGTEDKILEKIGVWAAEKCIKAIKVWLTNEAPMIFGQPPDEGSDHYIQRYREFTLYPGELITHLSLWDNGDSDAKRMGRIHLKTDQNREFDFGMYDRNVGQQCPVDVGSGICIGVFGGAGVDLDGLGFLFQKCRESTESSSELRWRWSFKLPSECVYQTVTPVSIVGGSGGNDFFFYMGNDHKVLRAIQVWAYHGVIRAVLVRFTDDFPRTFGDHRSLYRRNGVQSEEFQFHPHEFIRELFLYNRKGSPDQTGGIRFLTSEDRHFRCGAVEESDGIEEYSVNVGSGFCVGVVGASDYEINRLGFIFVERARDFMSSSIMVYQSPILVVGGSGGSEFSCYGRDGNGSKRLEKLGLWTDTKCIKALQVWISGDNPQTFGRPPEKGAYEEFAFSPTERLTRLILYDCDCGRLGMRVGWLCFETNHGRLFDFGLNNQGKRQKYEIDVGSGVCLGMIGGRGLDLDRLGFVFLR